MRFLFTTLQDLETEFYGRVGRQLERLGHEVAHVTWSAPDAAALRDKGHRTWCLPEVMDGLGNGTDIAAEVARIERKYDTPTIRDIYKTDWPCYGQPEEWCVRRTVRHFLALEQIIDEWRPEILVPEVGSETIRTATHLIGVERGIPVLFLFYTIFRDPLRLYRDTLHAPIVAADELRELSPEERAEIEGFIREFTTRRKPIRKHRQSAFIATNLPGLRLFARQALLRLRDPANEYMRPGKWAVNRRKERARSLIARRLYQPLRPGRQIVYFPLHVTDDYKIKRVIPHCVDQASLIEQVAGSLPHGYDLVLKEHPMSVGRNSLSMLLRLARIDNVRIVDPHESSHDLMQRSEAIVVISSTVGLEALMYGKPVMTMGQPFYSGYDVTLDIDSFREIREAVPALLSFRPDHERILQFLHAAMRRCYPGAPVLVDSSDENAAKLADSLDRAAREGVPNAHQPQAVA